ncbi:hypothetical protein V2J09_005774 [Rumex salicifolius]
MSSLAINWSPSSCQLQLAFKCRKSPSALFVRSRMLSSGYRRLRIVCVAEDEAGKTSQPQERRRSGDSWTSSGSADSDWSGSGQSDGGKSTEGVGGIIGAGLAGVFLVAGLSFAALAISRKTNSRRVQEMEPLSKQQEVLLRSDEEVSCKENMEDEDDIVNNDLESKIDTQNHSTVSKSTIDVLESSPGDDDVSTSSKHDKYASNGYGGPVKNLQSDPDAHLSTLQFPEAQNAIDSSGVPSNMDSPNLAVVVTPEQVTEHIDLVSVSLSSSDDKQGTLDSTVVNVSSHEVELSSETSSHYLDEDQFKDGSAGYRYGDSEPKKVFEGEHVVDASLSTKDLSDPSIVHGISAKENHLHIENGNSERVSVNTESVTKSIVDTLEANHQIDVNNENSSGNSFVSTGIPAPSILSASLLTLPGKVLVPAAVDQAHEQALAALQVIEVDAQPNDLCTRREYARWLVSASSALSRNSISKVYPAMYIENITDLAYDDITPEDPDFPSIQGLAEAGLISSKLSQQDMLSSPDTDIDSFFFFPDSPLSRQDLVTWKMALEKKQLPDTNRKMLQKVSGFIDIDRIDPNAWPAVLEDMSAGEHGIIAHAFGYTRLFQPDKPVTKAQAAIALGIGEAADIVSEELARIEAESVAENAVAAHSALVAEVEKDINASFEKELSIEREKIQAVEKMAEEARQEMEKLREEREKDNITLMKERTAIESEMEVFSKLRLEVEEQLESLMSKKAEISHEKERIENLRKETEEENQAIARLQYELEVERKALSMARSWAEDEAKRARENAKALEEARDRWEKRGLTIMVDDDLRKEALQEDTWVNVEKQISVSGVASRAQNLLDKLKSMASQVSGKSRELINMIILKITTLISALKERVAKLRQQTMELKDATVSKMGESVDELKQNAAGFTVTIQEGAKRVAGDCRDGVEKLTQKFKA